MYWRTSRASPEAFLEIEGSSRTGGELISIRVIKIKEDAIRIVNPIAKTIPFVLLEEIKSIHSP
jgi:hypothetical protein